MSLFETYPPSSFILAAVALALLLIGGLPLVVPFLVGVGLMALSAKLDLYGVRRPR